MTSVTADWVVGRDRLEYDVTETELGWMLVMRDGPITFTQIFESAPDAVARAQFVALLVAPVSANVH